jgi:hypothetical protein
MLGKRFAIFAPKDRRKTPTHDHAEPERDRRSSEPENWIVRKWIELADAILRHDHDESHDDSDA